MNADFSATSRTVGIFSAFGVSVLTLAYVGALAAGLLSLADKDAPIGDPWFTLLEVLILFIAPLIVVLFAALHEWAPPDLKTLSRTAFAFSVLLCGVTCCVHFIILTLSRATVAAAGIGDLLFSFKWPSAAYALDILAWDVFFSLAALFAAPLFFGSRLHNAARAALTISGVLSLAGLAGVAMGDMQWRNIGIVGYAGFFPVATALIGVIFLQTRPTKPTGDTKH